MTIKEFVELYRECEDEYGREERIPTLQDFVDWLSDRERL